MMTDEDIKKVKIIAKKVDNLFVRDAVLCADHKIPELRNCYHKEDAKVLSFLASMLLAFVSLEVMQEKLILKEKGE